MKDLRKIIETQAGKHSRLLTSAIDRANVSRWADLATIDKFVQIREAIEDMSNSGSVYSAKLAAIVGRYQDQLRLPRDWRKALAIKASKSQQTFMSMDDIRNLISFVPRNDGEKFIQISALIELRTGTRISDAKDLDERNEVEGMLCYVSHKTNTEAFIPCSETLLNLLRMRRAMNIAEYSDDGYNKALKRILGDCGITDEVKLYRRGEYREEEKCEAITSHTMRRTFCTQLHLSGEDVIDIMAWAGHSSVEMTRRYIRAHRKPGTPRWNFFEILDNLIQERFFGHSNPLSKSTPVDSLSNLAAV